MRTAESLAADQRALSDAKAYLAELKAERARRDTRAGAVAAASTRGGTMSPDNRCSWGGCDESTVVIHRTIYPRGFDGCAPVEIRPRQYCAACAELNRRWAADITRMAAEGETHNGRRLQPVSVIEIPILRPGVGDADIAIELLCHALCRLGTPLTQTERIYLEAA